MYRELTDAERSRLEVIGRLATIKHRNGVTHPFGPTAREIARAADRQRAKNLAEVQMQALEAGDDVDPVIDQQLQVFDPWLVRGHCVHCTPRKPR